MVYLDRAIPYNLRSQAMALRSGRAVARKEPSCQAHKKIELTDDQREAVVQKIHGIITNANGVRKVVQPKLRRIATQYAHDKKLNQAIKIYLLYKMYQERQSDEYLKKVADGDLESDDYVKRIVDGDIEKIELDARGITLLYDLKVTIPIDRIEKIFQSFGVIQLRSPKEDTKLLLGCGNDPIDSYYWVMDDHKHIGFITVNPALLMNPTVVAAFGKDLGLIQVLPKHFYKSLHTERVTIADHAKNLPAIFLECLKPGFQVFEVGNDAPQPFHDADMFWDGSL